MRAAGRLLGLTGTALNQYDTISQGSFLWIPTPETSVAACSLTVGAALEAGAEAYTTTATLASARIKAVPAGAVVGARKLVVDGVDIALDGDGNISSPEGLVALGASDTYRWWDEDGRKEPLRVSYQLANAEKRLRDCSCSYNEHCWKCWVCNIWWYSSQSRNRLV